ncbi:hypothetical protein [Nostoc sp.]|uniref:hypothetical protein n=1 Tax=Nostoc sp. TaxID=1180 RepID=UPI002FF4EC68
MVKLITLLRLIAGFERSQILETKPTESLFPVFLDSADSERCKHINYTSQYYSS